MLLETMLVYFGTVKRAQVLPLDTSVGRGPRECGPGPIRACWLPSTCRAQSQLSHVAQKGKQGPSFLPCPLQSPLHKDVNPRTCFYLPAPSVSLAALQAPGGFCTWVAGCLGPVCRLKWGPPRVAGDHHWPPGPAPNGLSPQSANSGAQQGVLSHLLASISNSSHQLPQGGPHFPVSQTQGWRLREP